MPSVAAASSIVAAEASTRRMWSASTRSSVIDSIGPAATPSAAPKCEGKWLSSIVAAEDRITLRSTALRSSRMLPGQG